MAMFLFKWFFLPLLVLAHPYYISVTEVEYRSKEKELGLSCKFYTDDFEEALKAFSKEKADLSKGDKSKNQKLISEYIGRHLKISISDKPLQLRFMGFENDQEATWCYFMAENIEPFKNIEIESDLLYEVKNEQVNLVHVTVDGNRKSGKLSHPDKNMRMSY
jgi:hypothetical protein